MTTATSVTPEVERIARAIEDYLAAYPEAADTVDGVAGWWLPAMGVVATVETAELVLEVLVGRGTVCRQSSADDRVLYSRCGRAFQAPS